MLAYLFPGQGSQREGMGKAWVDHPSFELVSEASRLSSRDLEYLLLDCPQDELTETKNAQIATFLMSLVVLDSIERLGIQPSITAGHSLGEYSALVASGAMSLEEGINLVIHRGEAMQSCALEVKGTMAALIGLDYEGADIACCRADGPVWVANDNASGQVVIAGEPAALDKAIAIAKELGAKKAMKLPVSGAFHTPFMADARESLRKGLSLIDWRIPANPVVANVDGKIHEGDEEWADLLSAQLCSPVRWRKTMDTITAFGVTTAIEVGPGGVLAGLARRAMGSSGVASIGVGTPEDLNSLLNHLGGDRTEIQEVPHGESVHVTERIVISPVSGVFSPLDNLISQVSSPAKMAKPGKKEKLHQIRLAVGDLVGYVGDVEVVTPFGGQLQGYLTIPGERVTEGQPVAWIRTEVASEGSRN